MMATAYSPAIMIKGNDNKMIRSSQKVASHKSNAEVQQKAKDKLKRFGLDF